MLSRFLLNIFAEAPYRESNKENRRRRQQKRCLCRRLVRVKGIETLHKRRICFIRYVCPSLRSVPGVVSIKDVTIFNVSGTNCLLTIIKFKSQLFRNLFECIIYGNIKTQDNIFGKYANDVFGARILQPQSLILQSFLFSPYVLKLTDAQR